MKGTQRDVTVGALAEGDFTNSGAWYGIDGYQRVFGARSVPSRSDVDAIEPDDTARSIRAAFLSNGADAESVRARIDMILAQNNGFFTLMQQFVGAGLVIAIAGPA